MDLIKFNDELTISSKEISDIIGKRHDHIMNDCSKLNLNYVKLNMPIIRSIILKRSLPNGGHVHDNMFILNKVQLLDLISGYSTEVRIKVNRRWEELEKSKNSELMVIPNFDNPAEAARAWADEYEKRTIAEKTVNMLEPKAALMDDLLHTENTYSFGAAAKMLEFRVKGKLIGRNGLMKFLREKSILMKTNVPYEAHVKKGHFDVKMKEITDGRIIPITQLTGRGIAWLAYNRVKFGFDKKEGE